MFWASSRGVDIVDQIKSNMQASYFFDLILIIISIQYVVCKIPLLARARHAKSARADRVSCILFNIYVEEIV